MEQLKQYLKVENQLTFSVNTQIKEQLKWLIGTGQIEPGDMLPTASLLADTLGLNRNTVNWVYNQLQDEGIVTMQRGKGTRVASGKGTELLRKERLPMKRLLSATIQAAQEEGLNLQQLFIAGLAYTLLDSNQQLIAQPILFIECSEHDHPFYREEIRRVTGREVKTILLETVKMNGIAAFGTLTQGSIIVTTLNHADDVKSLLSTIDQKVHIIGATVDPSIYLAIAKLQSNTTISFVCLGEAGGEWMARRVSDAGRTDLRSDAFGLDDKERLEAALIHSTKIYASEAVYSELKHRAPHQVELYPMRLEQGSENLLQQFLIKR
ncbi:GntR family transcriptional regulator [Paenibacillus sp. GSMTC-2017]|uniref:GntR family transcriptional regulator n=1 Tax=Paenibacillus sp. GSMTC-2017 TaxID=2794350 RepID=UPI0018D82D9C|nr:GntR family transcriptional regulator [Paenibacillus sp. GSMTC-2017]MBH5316741.1 GntR family transcriptional regulator [Paenibacillus sp. GSMTC-2017]